MEPYGRGMANPHRERQKGLRQTLRGIPASGKPQSRSGEALHHCVAKARIRERERLSNISKHQGYGVWHYEHCSLTVPHAAPIRR